MSLPFKSKSACMALGVLPSKDITLSKPVRKDSKLAFKVVLDAYPDAMVVMSGLLAISLP